MAKVIGIIEDNSITGVKYGTVEIPDTGNVETHTKMVQRTTPHPTVATQQSPKIKQPARTWQNKMSATKKQILDQQRTKQK